MAKRKDIQQDKSNPLAAASTDVPVITAPLLDPAMDAAAPMATEIATSDPAKRETRMGPTFRETGEKPCEAIRGGSGFTTIPARMQREAAG